MIPTTEQQALNIREKAREAVSVNLSCFSSLSYLTHPRKGSEHQQNSPNQYLHLARHHISFLPYRFTFYPTISASISLFQLGFTNL